MPPIFDLIFILLLGLEFGSFANVCIYRWPRGGTTIRPIRSRCPWCATEIRWQDNLPVVSYLLLGGRCRTCRAPISLRYPVVELSMGLLWAVTAFFLQRRAGADLIYLGLVFFFLFVIVVSTFTDLDWKIIPDKVTYPLMVAAVALAPWNETLASTGSVNRWIESTIGLAFGGVCLWLVALGGRAFFGKEVMGVGDIKLLAGFGAFLGWQGALVTLFVGSVIGAVFSLVGIASGLLRRRQYIPFGPFLNGGALVAFWLATAAPHLSFAGF